MRLTSRESLPLTTGTDHNHHTDTDRDTDTMNTPNRIENPAVIFSAEGGMQPLRAARELRFRHKADGAIDAAERGVWDGVTHDVVADLDADDTEAQWEAFDELLEHAYFISTDGYRDEFELVKTDNGDVLAVCRERLDFDAHRDLFGEDKQPPEGWESFDACTDCVVAIANDEYEHTELFERNTARAWYAAHRSANVQGSVTSFSTYPCECCGSRLHGDRQTVWAEITD